MELLLGIIILALIGIVAKREIKQIGIKLGIIPNPCYIHKFSGGWKDKFAKTAVIDHKKGTILLEVSSANFDLDYKLNVRASISPNPYDVKDWSNIQEFEVYTSAYTKTYKIRITVAGKNIITIPKNRNSKLKEVLIQEVKKYGVNADFNHIDIQNVTKLNSLLRCSGDSSPLANFNGDISKWNTSNVTSIKGMFSGAEAFNQPLIGRFLRLPI